MTTDTTGPLTDAEIAEIRADHFEYQGDCIRCYQIAHPCPTIRALDELAGLRRVVAEAVAALKQCNYAVSGLPGCITDALHRVPLTYEDERSVGERETYDAIRALVATASTEQEGT